MKRKEYRRAYGMSSKHYGKRTVARAVRRKTAILLRKHQEPEIIRVM